MKIDQFESDDMRRKDDPKRPWRKHGTPINKPPSNPDYPTQPFNHDEWMKNSKPMEEEIDGIPEKGDVIRTKKMQMQGKVESIGKSSYGTDEVMFRVEDGRLMKTPLSNVIVVQKLADDNMVMEVEEERVDEISTEVLAKYKKAAGQSASNADKKGDFATGNKRFSGIVKATKKQFSNDAKKSQVGEAENDNFTADDIKQLERIKDLPTLKAHAKELVKGKPQKRMKPEKIAFFYDKIDFLTNPNAVIKLMYDLLLAGEGNSVIGSRNSMNPNSYRSRFGEDTTDEGTMGGINRCAPSNDVSYEKVLDEVKAMWEQSQLNELSVEKLKAYKTAALSPQVAKRSPLRKVAKHVQGAHTADQKIKTKTGDRVGIHQPDRGTYESRLAEFIDVDEGKKSKIPVRPGQTKDEKYKGWNLRFQVKPREGSTEFEGMAVFAKSQQMKPISVKGNSADDVKSKLMAHIDDYRGNNQITANRVMVDFNAKIAQDIIGHGDNVYAEITSQNGKPLLLISAEDQGGMKLAQDRTATVNRKEGKIGQQAFSMSGNDARGAGLTHSRYTLGQPFSYTDNVVGYPLDHHSDVYPDEIIPMGEPGVTIAYPKGTGNA